MNQTSLKLFALPIFVCLEFEPNYTASSPAHMEIDKINLEEFLDESTSVFWVLDTRINKLEFISKSIEKLLNIKHEQMLEDPLCWVNQISLESLPHINSSYFKQKYLDHGNMEIPIELGFGQNKWLGIHWSRSIKNPNIITGWASDISAELEKKNSRKPIKDYMNDIYKYNTSGLVNINHELKSPINRILGLARLIEAANEEEGDLGNVVEMIEYNAGRLLGSINSLLELSKMGSKNEFAKLSQVDLSKTLFKLIPHYEKLASEKGIKIHFELDDFNLLLLGDEYLLSECCKIVIDNAIKFTEKGSITVRARSVSGTTKDSNRIELRIQDSGIGMHKEFLNSIFIPFKQESSGYNRNYRGLGIGMTLAKYYLKLLSGNIALESQKGEGTTVTMSFDQLSSN